MCQELSQYLLHFEVLLDLIQHNKHKPKKIYTEGIEESYDPQIEHLIDRKNFWKKAKAKLTKSESQLLQDHLGGLSGLSRAKLMRTSQQAQSKMLKNIYKKLQKLVVEI